MEVEHETPTTSVTTAPTTTPGSSIARSDLLELLEERDRQMIEKLSSLVRRVDESPVQKPVRALLALDETKVRDPESSVLPAILQQPSVVSMRNALGLFPPALGPDEESFVQARSQSGISELQYAIWYNSVGMAHIALLTSKLFEANIPVDAELAALLKRATSFGFAAHKDFVTRIKAWIEADKTRAGFTRRQPMRWPEGIIPPPAWDDKDREKAAKKIKELAMEKKRDVDHKRKRSVENRPTSGYGKDRAPRNDRDRPFRPKGDKSFDRSGAAPTTNDRE